MKITTEDGEIIDLVKYIASLRTVFLKSRKVIWHTIQKKVSKLLASNQFCELTYTDLVEFLEYCSKFIEIGEDFCNLPSQM